MNLPVLLSGSVLFPRSGIVSGKQEKKIVECAGLLVKI